MSENGGGWLGRLRAGLGRSSAKLVDGIGDLLNNRPLDAATLGDLEDVLITADLGVATAARLTADLGARRFSPDVTAETVRSALADDIATILAPVVRPIAVDPANRPHVILVCGVNGSGKTTTIAKLAKSFRDAGRSVTLAAGDTFRAAAIEQLQVWGDRAGCPVVAGAPGSDAAGLAFEAIEKARAAAADVLIIDTAGRLQNKSDLMEELQKIVRVIGKLDATAPHDRILVLDAGTGQNAHSQVEVFRDIVDISGLIVTKLDGSARGGVLVALADRFGLPVHAVGVGEGIDDLRPFEADAFARGLLGLDD